MSRWIPYSPTPDRPWNLARVVHLHRRAGLGATWAELQRDLSDGPDIAVKRLLKGISRSEGVPDEFETLSATIAKSAIDAEDEHRLKAWWVYRLLMTPDPLGERLTLMWHNHFATSLIKVTRLKWMHRQNLTFRQHARGAFGALLDAMLNDPALLSWLDAPQNRAGHPNENLARELLELFTLGIGNYTESDVRESARVLTGITIDDLGSVQFDSSKHDGDSKTILGKSGDLQLGDLHELLTSHPATARHIAWRLCREFCGENVVDDDALNELAAGLRTNQLRIDWAIETILRSSLFFSEGNLRSRIADPVSSLICPLRAFECHRNPPNTLAVADGIRRMGLNLFTPPNVGGWTGGRSWMSTMTVIARTNVIAELLQGSMQLPTEPIDLIALLDRYHIGDTLSDAIRFLGSLLHGDITNESVEQLARSVREETDRSHQLRTIAEMLLTSTAGHLH